MMNVIYLQLTSANQLIKLPVALDFSHSGGCTLFEVSRWIKPYMNETLYLCADCATQHFGKQTDPHIEKIENKEKSKYWQVALVNQEAREMWLPVERSHMDEFRVYVMPTRMEEAPKAAPDIHCLW